jgi:hypothetical protein
MILTAICTTDIKTNVHLLYVLNKFWCKVPEDDDNTEVTEKYTDCGTAFFECYRSLNWILFLC